MVYPVNEFTTPTFTTPAVARLRLLKLLPSTASPEAVADRKSYVQALWGCGALWVKMDAYDLFRRLGAGAKFDVKRFSADAARFQVLTVYGEPSTREGAGSVEGDRCQRGSVRAGSRRPGSDHPRAFPFFGVQLDLRPTLDFRIIVF